jgi:hypothetical protein
MAFITGSVTDISNTNLNLDNLANGEDYLFLGSSGLSTPIRKIGGGSLISVERFPTSGLSYFSESKSVTVTASDSTPTPLNSNIVQDLINFGGSTPRFGFRATLPAGTGERTTKILCSFYKGGANSDFEFKCSLSDNSASNSFVVSTGGGATNIYQLEVTYESATENQNLIIEMATVDDPSPGSSGVLFQGIWLSNAYTPPLFTPDPRPEGGILVFETDDSNVFDGSMFGGVSKLFDGYHDRFDPNIFDEQLLNIEVVQSTITRPYMLLFLL